MGSRGLYEEGLNMIKPVVCATLLCVSVSAFGQGNSGKHEDSITEPSLMWARGSNPRDAGGPRKSSPDMTFHGGEILTSVNIQAVFWGTSWTSTDPKIAGLQSFYQGFSGSDYAKTSDEYTGTNGPVGPTVNFQSYSIDTTSASGIQNGNNVTAVLQTVCRNVSPEAGGLGYYPVYTDQPRGHAGFCAWHAAGTCNGVPVQIGFFFKLDNDPGCDPADTQTGHPQGLAALANVSGHELSEARTDLGFNGAFVGWYDASGAENGDKCAWTFNVPYVSFPNGTIWKVQGEWSNAAYNAGMGYPNSSGQDGCLSGQ
jgi:hypothetical protein